MRPSLFERYSPTTITIVATLLAVAGSLSVTYLFISIVGLEQMNEYLAAILAALCPAIVAPPMIYMHCRAVRESADQRQKLSVINKELEAALDQVQELSGMLPICAWCHKVRDDKGYWEKVDAFIEHNTKASVTHGVCPDCQSHVLGDAKAGPVSV